MNYYFTARDAFRTDTISRTDLSLNFSTRIGGAVEIFVQPQVLNVFNSQGLVALSTTVRTSTSSPPALRAGRGASAFDPFKTKPVQGVQLELPGRLRHGPEQPRLPAPAHVHARGRREVLSPRATAPDAPAGNPGPGRCVSVPMTVALGRRPAFIFGVWTAAGVFFASQLYFLYPITSGGREISFGRALLINLPFYWLWALLTPAILGLARRFPLERARWKRSLAVHAGASVALSAVQLLVAGALLYAVVQSGGTSSLSWALGSFFRLNFHANILTYAALVALAWAAETYAKYRDRELAASQLQTQLVSAELGALKMQLQPHFLFNTLNAIAALLKPKPDAAESMVCSWPSSCGSRSATRGGRR